MLWFACNPEIFDMSMVFGRKLVTVVGPHFANAEWKLFKDVVNAIDHCPAGHA